ncbi:hypothetical protein H6G94_29405 [Nostoc punctiforme FACHB-252]|uniref:Transposase n=1 Tax=Nostoc punctiforme FACHB-252 TaxID=1357509 RepID=A0ABR8HJ61_NOSPU|nr:hypothetical protein [Nostoc punctiforme]MBD2615321.1 hypothetical protein [Nostoc punctiforme FACHB-252]
MRKSDLTTTNIGKSIVLQYIININWKKLWFELCDRCNSSTTAYAIDSMKTVGVKVMPSIFE